MCSCRVVFFVRVCFLVYFFSPYFSLIVFLYPFSFFQSFCFCIFTRASSQLFVQTLAPRRTRRRRAEGFLRGRWETRREDTWINAALGVLCFIPCFFYSLPSPFFFLFFFRSNWMCRSEDNNALKFSDGSFVYNVRSKHWKLENSFFSFSILNRWLVNHFCSAGFNIFYVSLVAFETGIFCIFSFFSFV